MPIDVFRFVKPKIDEQQASTRVLWTLHRTTHRTLTPLIILIRSIRLIVIGHGHLPRRTLCDADRQVGRQRNHCFARCDSYIMEDR
jgi:hypothetical protein